MARLEQYVKVAKKKGGYSELKKLYNDIKSGKIKIRDPSPPRDYLEYMMRPEYSLWAWTTISVLALTLFTIFFSDIIHPLIYFRYILGSITVLFLPGYVTIEALYPRERDLSPLERLALSIGLSLAIVPLIGLVLNYTPWGIRLEPIVASLTIYVTIIVFLALYRKYVTTLR